ncbi:hypothetical protein WA577_002737, partial [Blastocystis sp. JDR]
MFRSRLKRCQPLHPSASDGALKRGFVAPRQNPGANSTPAPLSKKPKTESVTPAPPITKKSFVSPLKVVPVQTQQKPQSEEKDSEKYCFSVMYCKAGPKKKKSYLDGILYIEKKSFNLFEASGKLVRKSLETYDPSDFVVGCTLDLGTWVVEVGNKLSVDDYASGRIFLQTPAAEPRPSLRSSPAVSKRLTLHVKKDAAPKTYTGLYSQTADSFVIQPSFVDSRGNTTAPVILDPALNQKMKPHQKEGLLFLYNCINGLGGFNGNGCILADEMGLGKTLTAISLIFTALTQSPWATPLITSAVVTCPSSLVENWGNEFRKWLGRDKVRCLILSEKGEKAEEKVNDFVMQSGLKRVVLIISYEMYRRYADKINASKAGLLVCDEGHRLKSSSGNATIDSLRQFPSTRRVLLSGTPIQNDME